MSKLKEQLYILCSDYIKARETEIRKTITEAQEAANNDTKSSAGDKFETGREIMQQEINLNMGRLNELNKLKQTLERIIPGQASATAQPGSLIHTNNGNYYIAISAGALKVNDVVYYAISAASPIGANIAGRGVGDEFTFNGRNYIIKGIS